MVGEAWPGPRRRRGCFWGAAAAPPAEEEAAAARFAAAAGFAGSGLLSASAAAAVAAALEDDTDPALLPVVVTLVEVRARLEPLLRGTAPARPECADDAAPSPPAAPSPKLLPRLGLAIAAPAAFVGEASGDGSAKRSCCRSGLERRGPLLLARGCAAGLPPLSRDRRSSPRCFGGECSAATGCWRALLPSADAAPPGAEPTLLLVLRRSQLRSLPLMTSRLSPREPTEIIDSVGLSGMSSMSMEPSFDSKSDAHRRAKCISVCQHDISY